MVQDRQGASDRRGPRRSAPRTSGSDRARRAQPKPEGEAPRPEGPPIPTDIEAKQLSPEIRGELTTLDRATADVVARHLVAAGELPTKTPSRAGSRPRCPRSIRPHRCSARGCRHRAPYHCATGAGAGRTRAARRMAASRRAPLTSTANAGLAARNGRSSWPGPRGRPTHRRTALRSHVAGARSDPGSTSRPGDRRPRNWTGPAPGRRPPGCSTPTPKRCSRLAATQKHCNGSSTPRPPMSTA